MTLTPAQLKGRIKNLAVWLKPQIFQMDSSDDVVNILFLDEIAAAPAS